MPDQDRGILDRNFVLKRMGDILYLPCEKEIACKAPSYLANVPYLMCKTARFDPSIGRLSLNLPTDYVRYNETAYQISIQTNSAVILSSKVESFDILYGSSSVSAYCASKYDWGNLDSNIDWTPTPQKSEQVADTTESAQSTPTPPHRISISGEYPITIQEMTFADAKVSFTWYVHPTLGTVTFEIPHSESKKEYDAIKGYFEKVLRSKTLKCHLTLEAIGGTIQSKTARLSQEDVINGTMIEKVTDYCIKSEILDCDDPITLVEEKLAAVIDFSEDERNLIWLLNKIDKFKTSKHYYHLSHLSSLHDAASFRLRMTGKPVSFIFAVQGAHDYHLVWETYETEEATYVWKLQGRDTKSRQKEVGELLERIKWLRAQNKVAYIQSKPSNFKRIEHDYGQENGGLEKWKASLSEYIT